MTNSELKVTVNLLRELLVLNSVDGSLIWKTRSPSHFKPTLLRSSDHICCNWNSLHAGKPALTCVDGSGHLTGRIFGRAFYAHRIVFAMTTGNWPVHSIDHINGKPADNRPENLRDVPHIQNLRNQSIRKNNSTGVNGVSFNKRLGKWMSHISVGGKYIHLGFHELKESAIAARIAANNEYGFHKNHGRIAA